ncbi:MAG: thioesterase family protein [Actinomycetota bacterium]|nr:thioesterase family protein [Acidimicrobiia bacterium]MDQ3294008.1 thioesterase family protein [Actinomycetota bacterium]
MGSLARDTAVEGGDGRYRAQVSRDWEIWGPMGGYVAAIALRAAGAESPFGRPASLSVHYLGVAQFEEVQLSVVPLRVARQAASHRVTMTQGNRAVLEALVWSVADDAAGLEHDVAVMPDVPPWTDLQSPQERLGEDAPPPFPFWRNFDSRPVDWVDDWPPPAPMEPLYRNWMRFADWEPGADPWLDCARAALLVDLPSWPSGSRPHAWAEPKFIAPTLDLNVAFHRLAPDDGWLLLEGTSPVANDALMAWTGRLWTTGGQLVASGGGQTMFRPIPG